MLIQSGHIQSPPIAPNSEYRIPVHFPKAYGGQAHVDVAIAAVEQEGGQGLSLTTLLDGITSDRFEITVRAGANTKLHKVTLRWTAFGISAEHWIDRDAHALEDPIEIIDADAQSGETASAAA